MQVALVERQHRGVEVARLHLALDERLEPLLVEMPHAEHHVEHLDDAFARLLQRGVPALGFQRRCDRAQERLEAVDALNGGRGRNADRLGGRGDFAAELQRVGAQLRQLLHERVRGRGAAVLELPRGLGELRAEFREAPGKAGELTVQLLDVDVHEAQAAQKF
jgi:hypothetical protein